MLKPPLKLILCDLGNVLINFDHRLAVRKILPFTDKSFDEIYQFFFDSPLTEKYETGRISSIDFFQSLEKQLNISHLSYESFIDIWNEIFFENKGMLELLLALKQQYRLHLLSNINELHCTYIQKKFSKNLSIFNKLYFSHEIGFRKPHPEAYKKSVMDCAYLPQETLYIDDREDLIRFATDLGFQAVLFKSVGQLKSYLQQEEVLH
ncbi:MAG: HAD family phosphatase [Candidatus Omnitrophota bacterium]